MTIDTDKLRHFAQWIERRYPEGTAKGVVEAADHIDAQAAEIERLKVRADAADVALREAAEVINDRNAEIERLRVALTTIKEWPNTSPLNMDAHNMQVVAIAALSGEGK